MGVLIFALRIGKSSRSYNINVLLLPCSTSYERYNKKFAGNKAKSNLLNDFVRDNIFIKIDLQVHLYSFT
jgi:hypothetical protein